MWRRQVPPRGRYLRVPTGCGAIIFYGPLRATTFTPGLRFALFLGSWSSVLASADLVCPTTRLRSKEETASFVHSEEQCEGPSLAGGIGFENLRIKPAAASGGGGTGVPSSAVGVVVFGTGC